MKPNERLGAPRWAWMIWGIVVIASLVVAPHLPARIPTHFGANGKPNGYSNRWVGIFLMPGLMLMLLLLWQILWRIDPKRQNYPTMAPTYRYVGGLVIGFLALVQAYIVSQAMHLVVWNGTRLIGILVGLLVALLANVLPRVKANWWLGIRTPWTLSDEDVWRKTHQLGGQTGVVAGLIMVVSNVVLPIAWIGAVTVAVVILWALALAVASYWFSVHP